MLAKIPLLFFLLLINPCTTLDHSQQIQAFKGRVVSVQKYSYVNRAGPYVQFIIQIDEKEYTVKVGPEWYVNAGGVLIIPREEIEVKGFFICIDDKPFIVASEIKKGSMQLDLRDENGTPLWQERQGPQ